MQFKRLLLSKFKNTKCLLSGLGILFYIVFVVSLFVPTKNKIFGTFNYTVDGVILERIVLRIDNTASYYQNKNGQLIEWNDGSIKKWRAVLNRNEEQEYKEQDLYASIIQIQMCNNSNQSFFQLFKMSNEMLYSKLGTGGVYYQKCFLKE